MKKNIIHNHYPEKTIHYFVYFYFSEWCVYMYEIYYV